MSTSAYVAPSTLPRPPDAPAFVAWVRPHRLALSVERLAWAGALAGASIGIDLVPGKVQPSGRRGPDGREGRVIEECVLREVSLVPVPKSPTCVRVRPTVAVPGDTAGIAAAARAAGLRNDAVWKALRLPAADYGCTECADERREARWAAQQALLDDLAACARERHRRAAQAWQELR
jgi:hypothetical protein